jgi:hypothetical protein
LNYLTNWFVLFYNLLNLMILKVGLIPHFFII